jgi:ribosomal protein S2
VKIKECEEEYKRKTSDSSDYKIKKKCVKKKLKKTHKKLEKFLSGIFNIRIFQVQGIVRCRVL